MNSLDPNYRPSLNTSQSAPARRFFFSLAVSFVTLLGTAVVLAQFVIPHFSPPETLVRVISSPSSQTSELPPTGSPPSIVRPLSRPPVRRLTASSQNLPTTPLFETPPIEHTQLLAQSEEALLALELFQEEEAKRLEELQRQKEALALSRKEAQEKTASTLANQVASAPSVAHRTAPSYPDSARRNGVQGTTRIAATITSTGTVSSPRIIASSGHNLLDSSALSAVKEWRFNPAKNGLGQPIAFQMTIPVTFRLN